MKKSSGSGSCEQSQQAAEYFQFSMLSSEPSCMQRIMPGVTLKYDQWFEKPVNRVEYFALVAVNLMA